MIEREGTREGLEEKYMDGWKDSERVRGGWTWKENKERMGGERMGRGSRLMGIGAEGEGVSSSELLCYFVMQFTGFQLEVYSGFSASIEERFDPRQTG